MRRRRALIVTHLAPPHVGGVERLASIEADWLARTGWDVHLLSSDGGISGTETECRLSYRLHRIPAWHGLEHRFGLPYPVFAPLQLWRALCALSPTVDVIHVHGFVFPSTVAAVMAARIFKRPLVLTDHGGFQDFDSALARTGLRALGRTVGRFTVRTADVVIAYNQRVLKDLRTMASDRVRFEFLANPIRSEFRFPTRDERQRARRKLGLRPPVVAFIGRMVPEKGVGTLTRLAEGVKGWSFVFCGPGSRESVERIRQAGAVWLPPRDSYGVREVLWSADVLAAPSKQREGFPVVAQEALRCGIPVVLGWDPGFAPYAGERSLIFCRPEPESVARGIEQALAVGVGRVSERWLQENAPRPQTWIQRLTGLLEYAISRGHNRRLPKEATTSDRQPAEPLRHRQAA